MKKKPKTICMVGGSFDPITVGHAHLIQQAARMADELHVVIGVNPAKKYLFSEAERLTLVHHVVGDLDIHDTPVHIHFLKNRLLIQLAHEVGVTHLVRGIRSTEDFTYETQMALLNRKFNPVIQTLYIVPPPELSEVSSSTVKGLVGLEGWQGFVSQYVHPKVLDALARTHLNSHSKEA
ncbi:pantetheine-phosphate adenylyltransferase [Paraburkholderia sp. A2RO-4L]|uniref:pantetheine-phosphate adenylyltransferase n=1 Tax=Paraburkholderia sp. A2RO-4L TaxID=3028374 RepID=UPI0032F39169|nr:pantetheine-phosphate adenylyltransferase [Burkholderia vietnamiensis]